MSVALLDPKTPLRCAYDEGMISARAPNGAEVVKVADRLYAAALAHHEAGHVVLSEVLGLGNEGAEIHTFFDVDCEDPNDRESWGTTTVVFATGSFAGSQSPDGVASSDNHRAAARGDFGAALKDGVILCAGNAAERRFFFERGLIDFWHGSEAPGSDHSQIAAHEIVHPNLRHTAWREAQRAIDDPALWSAIQRVANALEKRLSAVMKKRSGEPGAINGEMSGWSLKTVMGRSGIRCGIWTPNPQTAPNHST